MTIIEQTNDLVRVAIVAVRIERNPVTMGSLYDALNKRRNARAYVTPQKTIEAWERLRGLPYYNDLTHGERIAMLATV